MALYKPLRKKNDYLIITLSPEECKALNLKYGDMVKVKIEKMGEKDAMQ